MSFDDELGQRLDALREQNLFRELRRVDSPQSPHIKIGDKTFLNFSSNDYLGLANHSIPKKYAGMAVREFGAGSGASRLICGSLGPFHDLEVLLAKFKGTEAALTFSTGFATAQGVICALLSKDDIIILDKLVHASIVDAAKLSGAKIRVFTHNDLEDLEEKLKWAADTSTASPARHVLIVTESIFSMDGDAAPLRDIVALKSKYGAWLMVDEAHATGILGAHGRGLADELGVSTQIEIQMGTLGKALGASGGYICGSRNLIDYLINRARSFIFSTAPVPAAAAAATGGILIAMSKHGDGLRKHLQSHIKQFQSKIVVAGGAATQSAIIPIILGDEKKAVDAATKLREQNIFVPAIRYPSVARGAARLRITLTAAHFAEDIERLVSALKTLV